MKLAKVTRATEPVILSPNDHLPAVLSVPCFGTTLPAQPIMGLPRPVLAAGDLQYLAPSIYLVFPRGGPLEWGISASSPPSERYFAGELSSVVRVLKEGAFFRKFTIMTAVLRKLD